MFTKNGIRDGALVSGETARFKKDKDVMKLISGVSSTKDDLWGNNYQKAAVGESL